MIIKKDSIKNISVEFDNIKNLFDGYNFYADFVAIIFEYNGNDKIDTNTLSQLLLNQEKIYVENSIKKIDLIEAKRQFAIYRECHESMPEKKKLRIERLFWEKIQQHADLPYIEIYSGKGSSFYSQWHFFWIINDPINRKGFILSGGAFD